jgi:uroporphyrinogen-III synthase
VLEVRRGGALLDGELMPLTRTGHAVLTALAEAGGDVVNRSQLLASLPGATSDVHAVEVAVARIREACGAKGLIQTIVKRGYRLAVTSREEA